MSLKIQQKTSLLSNALLHLFYIISHLFWNITVTSFEKVDRALCHLWVFFFNSWVHFLRYYSSAFVSSQQRMTQQPEDYARLFKAAEVTDRTQSTESNSRPDRTQLAGKHWEWTAEFRQTHKQKTGKHEEACTVNEYWGSGSAAGKLKLVMHVPTWHTHNCHVHGLVATGGLTDSKVIADLFHLCVQTSSAALILTVTGAS